MTGTPPWDYFRDTMERERQAMLWAAALRRQLDRWETLSTRFHRREGRGALSTIEMWEGWTERHFVLVAADHLLKALNMFDTPPSVDPVVKDEIAEARDLNEHWDENMPHFHVSSRPGALTHKTGKSYEARNPGAGPYNWWSWQWGDGPLLTPNVLAEQVHDLVEIAIDAVRCSPYPDLADAVPTRPASPWKA